MSVDKFTLAGLSRRMSTSVAARVWDPCGKSAPLLTKFKYDLRKLIEVDGNWDKPLPPHFRAPMVEAKNFLYKRYSISEDALVMTARLIVLGDAA